MSLPPSLWSGRRHPRPPLGTSLLAHALQMASLERLVVTGPYGMAIQL